MYIEMAKVLMDIIIITNLQPKNFKITNAKFIYKIYTNYIFVLTSNNSLRFTFVRVNGDMYWILTEDAKCKLRQLKSHGIPGTEMAQWREFRLKYINFSIMIC